MKFILLNYIDRSGSSFLMNELSKHPYVLTFPEMAHWSGILLRNGSIPFSLKKKPFLNAENEIKEHPQLKQWNISCEILRQLQGKTYSEVFFDLLSTYAAKVNAKAKVWVFKQQFFDAIPNIEDAFRARGFKITPLILLRHPCAIFNSQLKAKEQFPELSFNNNPLFFSKQWNALQKATKISDIQTVYYEELLENTKTIITQLYQQWQLNTNATFQNTGTYFQTLNETEKILHDNITSAADKNRIDAWKNELGDKYQQYLKRKLVDTQTQKYYIPGKPMFIWLTVTFDIIYKFKNLLKRFFR